MLCSRDKKLLDLGKSFRKRGSQLQGFTCYMLATEKKSHWIPKSAKVIPSNSNLNHYFRLDV